MRKHNEIKNIVFWVVLLSGPFSGAAVIPVAVGLAFWVAFVDTLS